MNREQGVFAVVLAAEQHRDTETVQFLFQLIKTFDDVVGFLLGFFRLTFSLHLLTEFNKLLQIVKLAEKLFV